MFCHSDGKLTNRKDPGEGLEFYFDSNGRPLKKKNRDDNSMFMFLSLNGCIFKADVCTVTCGG